ncbi:MAG: efflux transporter outer membrane subunit [Smithellaceae bacterium]|nr:efflux transporter outer membrane subunit [Smithellaceae bacterium]
MKIVALIPVWLILCMGMLAGCVAGPDFKRPAAPEVAGYSVAPLPAQTVSSAGALGQAQRFMPGAKTPTSWWRQFESPKLDALIEQALQASPSLEAANATLRQARQTYEARAGATLHPQMNARLGAQRLGTNTAASGQSGGERVFDLYNASVDVSYNLDLSGGNRRTLEALAAQADYQGFQREGARLTVAANVATAAMAQAQLISRIEATEAILAAQSEQLDITRARLNLGAASGHDFFTWQTQVEQTRALIPPLHSSLAQITHLLAVLAGQPPGAGTMPQFALADFNLATDLPVSVPSELVRQRPDIRASEALLHAASAQYGLSVSKLYPQISLSANLGSQAITLASLFGPGSLVWGLAGQLAQPLFQGGLRAESRAAEAGFDAAAANYRQTVLQALRNVADVLSALDYDARTLAAQAAAHASALESLRLVEQQYGLGAVSYLALLTARQQAEQTRLSLITAQTQRLSDTVALYQAMGGGWLHDEGTAATGEPL